MDRPFLDRREAGRVLAGALGEYAGRPGVVVLGLPRGGVPVAFEVARAIGAPLDVFLVRKLGVPGREELAMGAIASGGVRHLNDPVIRALRIPPEVIDAVTESEGAELARRERAYRDDRPPVDFRGKTVILVDDGLATGSSMRAAVIAVRRSEPAEVVVAAPVASAATCEELSGLADHVVCARTPDPFQAVGLGYEDFSQTTDDEVRDLLAASAPGGATGGDERLVRVEAGDVELEGDLAVPPGAVGVVLFAHGSGSGRQSPRNREVARALREGGLATLLVDLLTPDESEADARTARLRFDIPRLARRLVGATDWLGRGPETAPLKVGYFGASTGAAAALVAAAGRPASVAAVVSRGGRPDLAGPALALVQAPTLLIVGSLDAPVIPLNRDALRQLGGPKDLVIVPGASHLFEEPGALDEVSRLARDWFLRHLKPPET